MKKVYLFIFTVFFTLTCHADTCSGFDINEKNLDAFHSLDSDLLEEFSYDGGLGNITLPSGIKITHLNDFSLYKEMIRKIESDFSDNYDGYDNVEAEANGIAMADNKPVAISLRLTGVDGNDSPYVNYVTVDLGCNLIYQTEWSYAD